MSEQTEIKSNSNSGLISTNNVVKSAAEYIWDSPCLKPLVFHPLVVSGVILLLLFVIDMWYGKHFTKCKVVNQTIAHAIASYMIIAGAIVANNVVVKHHYRLKKQKKEGGQLLTEYV